MQLHARVVVSEAAVWVEQVRRRSPIREGMRLSSFSPTNAMNIARFDRCASRGVGPLFWRGQFASEKSGRCWRSPGWAIAGILKPNASGPGSPAAAVARECLSVTRTLDLSYKTGQIESYMYT